jgi:hypothetical protein
MTAGFEVHGSRVVIGGDVVPPGAGEGVDKV